MLLQVQYVQWDHAYFATQKPGLKKTERTALTQQLLWKTGRFRTGSYFIFHNCNIYTFYLLLLSRLWIKILTFFSFVPKLGIDLTGPDSGLLRRREGPFDQCSTCHSVIFPHYSLALKHGRLFYLSSRQSGKGDSPSKLIFFYGILDNLHSIQSLTYSPLLEWILSFFPRYCRSTPVLRGLIIRVMKKTSTLLRSTQFRIVFPLVLLQFHRHHVFTASARGSG